MATIRTIRNGKAHNDQNIRKHELQNDSQTFSATESDLENRTDLNKGGCGELTSF